MFSVIIADDESTIRENLPKVINFATCGFNVVAKARNGEEAFAQIEQYKPDLVMVDVSMPVLDGLGLIERMRKTGYGNIPVIILSGYSDFSYAQKAVKLGVKAYLSKPIDEDEAEALLRDIRETLLQNEHMREQEEINQQKKLLADTFVAQKALKQPLNDVLMYCTVLSLHTADESDTPYHIMNTVTNSLFHGYDFLYQVNDFFYIFYLPKAYIDEHFEDYMQPAKSLQIQLAQKGMECIPVIDAQILQQEGAFSENISFHKSQVLTRIFYGEKNPFIYKSMPAEDGTFWRAEYETPFLNAFQHNLHLGNQEKILDAFTKLTEKIKEVKPPLNRLVALSNKWFYIYTEALSSYVQQENNTITSAEWIGNTYFYSFDRWKIRQKDLILEVCMVFLQTRKMSNLGVYGEVLSYVRQHYYEPISMKEVADHFYLNAAYLGRMFQKATGVGFKQYVNELRIQEAKRLLTQTDKRIYEIAEMVGYTESKYFVTKFTQETGISPKEYRQTYR